MPIVWGNIHKGGLMPLKGTVSQKIRELYKDNKKSGKARGAGGKLRSRAQIIAIALSKSKKKGKK